MNNPTNNYILAKEYALWEAQDIDLKHNELDANCVISFLFFWLEEKLGEEINKVLNKDSQKIINTI